MEKDPLNNVVSALKDYVDLEIRHRLQYN